MKFVLHSHDRLTWQIRPAQPQVFLHVRFLCQIKNKDGASFMRNVIVPVCHLENDTHVPLVLDYTVCGFISEQSSFQFTWYQNEMSSDTRTRISFGLKTRMNSFWNDLCGKDISSWCHVNRYREVCGDGMNSFWNESHSGIMWTAPNYSDVFVYARQAVPHTCSLGEGVHCLPKIILERNAQNLH